MEVVEESNPIPWVERGRCSKMYPLTGPDLLLFYSLPLSILLLYILPQGILPLCIHPGILFCIAQESHSNRRVEWSQ
jgi:hypothetical protein